MAWRIDEAVIRGEIDNSIEGRTTGRIWLAGREAPLVLHLLGDCWRDLAGTRLWFRNPEPHAVADAAALDTDQSGVVGDMTASRKSKVLTVTDEELQGLYQNQSGIPHEWRNTLYLEWFSEINGRVVIESSTYLMEISAHEWTMDEDAEEAQKLANLHAMRDFMAQLIQRRNGAVHEDDDEDEDEEDELDEFAWEERLKESDRLTDAYQEVLEKYMEDSDSERKEAFVMGWDGLLDALAQRDENGGERDLPWGGEANRPMSELPCDDDSEEDEDFLDPDDMFFEDDEEGEQHPLQLQAQEVAMRAMDMVREDAVQGSPAYQLVSSLLQVSGKLAGALNDDDGEFLIETGYVLAILKRCLNWLNEAVGACQQLMTMENDPDQLAALAHLRSSIFSVRDGVVELRRELK